MPLLHADTHKTTAEQWRTPSVDESTADYSSSNESDDEYFPPFEEIRSQGWLDEQQTPRTPPPEETANVNATNQARPNAQSDQFEVLGAETPTPSPTDAVGWFCGLLTSGLRWLLMGEKQPKLTMPILTGQAASVRRVQSTYKPGGNSKEGKDAAPIRRQRPNSITMPPDDRPPPVTPEGQSTWRDSPPSARRYSELVSESMAAGMRRRTKQRLPKKLKPVRAGKPTSVDLV